MDSVLITIAGPDRPGITAEVTKLLADANVRLLDVEQVVVQGFLNLHFLIDLELSASRPVLMELLWKARELEVEVDFVVRPRAEAEQRPAQSWAVTIVSDEVGAKILAEASATAARHGFNIDSIRRLSGARFASVEMLLGGRSGADIEALRADFIDLERKHGCDLSVQREGLLRRSKRLIIMDMDSTLIQQEVIDELAREAGAYEKVAAATERAMNGEIGFDEALRERCMALAGAPASAFEAVLDRIELTPGAERLVKVLQRLGYRLAVISGGFTQVVEPLRRRLGLDYAFANELEVVDGKLTGKLVGPIVNRQRKADLLESLAQTERVSLDQVIAVGDGANDLDMLGRAGLGIAFNAKRSGQEQADHTLNQKNLDAILYLLGLRDRDIEQLAS